eukprot:CAMPEP_0119549496 /NCGR_PEP_ID=MMETSP1352-20130426/3167_1 /TAXON_ID=265584 /ORGANISM="Stauroneis constricta, Strain CCMP1120" /LENGTH=464 /DNA_ID=CAMNT_0007595059 /DNA_START=162 /DNA_END=1556 /DNA_ORIENTATION=+
MKIPFACLLACVASATAAAEEASSLRRDLVAAAASDGPDVCPMAYTLTYMNGNTVPPPPITIIEQNGDTVKFKVHQVWSPTDADNIFVEYKASNLGESECVEYAAVEPEDDIEITAHCMHLDPIAVVDIYVVDNAVDGDATIPACCHSGTPPTVDTVHYTYALECNPTCPDPQGDPDCPEVLFDFNEFPEYSYVFDDYWYKHGVKITAKSNSNRNSERYTPLPKDEFPIGSAWEDRYGFEENNPSTYTDDVWDISLHNQGGGAARVFNTLKPNGDFGNAKCQVGNSNEGDTDLGSPHGSCPNGTPGKVSGGPGIGDGGHRNSNYANCPSPALGNVLIIQEQMKSCPDDSSNGGTITFDFNPNIAGDIDFTFAKILDTDEGVTPKIKVWKSNENVNNAPSTPVFTTPKTGNNGLWYEQFSTNGTWQNRYKGLKRIQFVYSGSGCVAEIGFKPSKCPPASPPPKLL